MKFKKTYLLEGRFLIGVKIVVVQIVIASPNVYWDEAISIICFIK
jgi:hypothetical protein